MRSRLDNWTHRPGWRMRPVAWAWAGLCLLSVTACDNSPTVSKTPEATPETVPETATPMPPPPPDGAFLALLPPEQTNQIRALGLPLVLPTAIPEGFEVAQVQTQPDERFAGYQILYRDQGVPAGSPAEHRCFLVEFTEGGIGGTPTTENRLALKPPILAEDGAEYGLNYGPYTDAALREQFPEPSLVSDWLPVAGGFVRLAGAALINNTLTPSVACTDITVEAAVSIIDSLAVIADEIQGDGVPAE